MTPDARALLTAGTLGWFAVAAPGEALFEQTLAQPMPRGVHGYRGMPGDIIELKDGTLLMAFTVDGAIRSLRSTDRGRTWGQPAVLIPAPPRDWGYFAHPSFLRLPNDEILLSYIHSTHPTTPYYANNYYRRSSDEATSWSEPFVMTPYPGYVLVHNDRLFLLSTGRIIAMAEYKLYKPSTEDHSGFVGLCFFSDDLGHSWRPSANVVDMQPVEVQEAGGVELRDGRLMMFARTYSGFPVRAYSSDGGETWSPGEKMNLPMPYAGLPTVVRLPKTGDLLFIWISERSTDRENPQVHRRCALTSAISRDEGQTFLSFRHIARDPEDDFGYQSVTFVGEDLAVLSYHCRDGLRVARIGIDWFYGGSPSLPEP